MKKILAIGHSFVLAQNRDVFRCLHSRGKWDVTILAPRFFHGDLRDIEMEQEPPSSNMRVLPIDCYFTSRIHFFTYNIFQIEKILKEEEFDAVYLWEEAYIVSGFTLAHVFHKHKIPYFVYSCQNIYKKYPWPFSFLENKVHQHAQRLLACGYGVKEVFQRKGFESDVVPFFVNLERFKPQSLTEKEEVKKLLGLQEKITLGFMGRLVEEKGLSLFMATLDKALLQEKCNIIVIGSGSMQNELKAWLDRKANARLLFLKHDEVPEILSILDIILCPSQTRSHWKEQFGRMLVEAFASGVVVVGSDSGEIPYVVGKAGIVIGESDIEGWTRETITLIRDEQRRALMIREGLVRAQNYSTDSIAEELFKVVETSLRLG